MVRGFMLATILWVIGLAVIMSFGVIAGAQFAPWIAVLVLIAMAWVHAFFMCGPAWLFSALVAEVMWVSSSACFLAGFLGGLRGAGVADILASMLVSEAMPWIAVLLFAAMAPVIIAARLNRIAVENMKKVEAEEEVDAGS